MLRLVDVPPPASTRNLWDLPAVLLQKLPGNRFLATTKLIVTFRNEGDRAGLVLLGKNYGSLAVTKTRQGNVLRELICLGADRGVSERVAAEVPISQDTVYLRATTDEGTISFSFSLDGKEFHPIGESLAAKPGVWVGSKLGIYATGNSKSGEFGYADFDWFRFARFPQ